MFSAIVVIRDLRSLMIIKKKLFKIFAVSTSFLTILSFYILGLFLEQMLHYPIEKVLLFSKTFCCRQHSSHLDYCNILFLVFLEVKHSNFVVLYTFFCFRQFHFKDIYCETQCSDIQVQNQSQKCFKYTKKTQNLIITLSNATGNN